MSADNYNYVDYHPTDPNGAWSVTNGFESDNTPPEHNGSTKWFNSLDEADRFAHDDWTEYGVRWSPRAEKASEQSGTLTQCGFNREKARAILIDAAFWHDGQNVDLVLDALKACVLSPSTACGALNG
jgi:hypothetical protein